MSASVDKSRICDFLYRESRLLDDEQWDEWLTCYHPEAVFWMPCFSTPRAVLPAVIVSMSRSPRRRTGLRSR